MDVTHRRLAVTSASRLGDWLLAHGRTCVTTVEAAELLGVPVEQVRVRLNGPAHEGLVFTPARGLWVPVPPEFRTWGVTPALHFLDDLMRHLGREYYAGWLSAAEVHGAAHQRPQVTQVAVDRPVQDRGLGRVRVQFHTRSDLVDLPRLQLQVPTGQVWVSSPELTAVDLADDPERGGGVSNVATVLADLASDPGLDGRLLAGVAARFPSASARRLGYLLGVVEAPTDLSPLRALVGERPLARPAVLTPHGPRRGRRDSGGWGVLVNTDVEPDL
jgi:predicted transcriptional regulator of viral defense system